MPLNLLTLPLWWYSTGLEIAFGHTKQAFSTALKKSALRIFVRHIADPLYGYRGKGDRVMSALLRLILLVGKSIFLIVQFVLIIVGLLLYLAAVPLIIFAAIRWIF